MGKLTVDWDEIALLCQEDDEEKDLPELDSGAPCQTNDKLDANSP